MSEKWSAAAVLRGALPAPRRLFEVIGGSLRSSKTASAVQPALPNGATPPGAVMPVVLGNRSEPRLVSADRRPQRNSSTGSNVLSIVVPASGKAFPASGRTLIVAAEAELRLTLSTMLSGAGLTIDDADSREAALHMLQMERFDLVLLDINMPGTNPLETCQSIRAKCRASIVMLDLLSAWSLGGIELLAQIQSGLCRGSRPSTGDLCYRDPAILRLIAAVSGAV